MRVSRDTVCINFIRKWVNGRDSHTELVKQNVKQDALCDTQSNRSLSIWYDRAVQIRGVCSSSGSQMGGSGDYRICELKFMHLRRTWYLHVPAQAGCGCPNSRVNIFGRTHRGCCERFRLIGYFDICRRGQKSERIMFPLRGMGRKYLYNNFYGIFSIACIAVNKTLG